MCQADRPLDTLCCPVRLKEPHSVCVCVCVCCGISDSSEDSECGERCEGGVSSDGCERWIL